MPAFSVHSRGTSGVAAEAIARAFRAFESRATLLIAALIGLVFAATFIEGIGLGALQNIPVRYSLYVFPYLSGVPGTGPNPGDEIGYFTFALMATELFGKNHAALYLFYYLIWAGSLGAAMLAMRKSAPWLFVLLILLCAVNASQHAYWLVQSLRSLTNPRIVELLSIFALVHLLWFAVTAARATPFNLALVALQCGVVILAIHMRVAVHWQVIVLAAVGLVVAAKNWRGAWRALSVPLIVGGVIAVNGALVPALFHYDYYRAPRIFWHNVGIGMSVNAFFRDTEGIASVNDFAFTQAVARWLLRTGQIETLRTHIVGNYRGTAAPAAPDLDRYANYTVGPNDLAAYEAAGRRYIVSMARDQPLQFAAAFLYHKPRMFLETILWSAGLIEFCAPCLGLDDQKLSIPGPGKRSAMGLYVDPLRPIALLPMLLGALLLAARRDDTRWPVVAVPALCFAGSTIPLFATYPAFHVAAGAVTLLVAVGYGLLAQAVVYAARHYQRIVVA